MEKNTDELLEVSYWEYVRLVCIYNIIISFIYTFWYGLSTFPSLY
jgi:hypothetical protein